jgi:hypothetical protein
MQQNPFKNELTYFNSMFKSMQLFMTEPCNDHSKRVFLKYFFSLLDNYLKFIPRCKNKLYRENVIKKKEKQIIEEKIKVLEKDFNGQYDIIRDKFSSHQQDLDFTETIQWWNEIDLISIEIFLQNILEINKLLNISTTIQKSTDLNFPSLLTTESITVSSDRFSVSKKNAISMIPLNNFQKHLQLIIGIVNNLKINLTVTSVFNNRQMVYESMIFLIGWFNVIDDTISFLDNCYSQDTKKYLEGLNNNEIILKLEESEKSRDNILEDKLRQIRNKLTSHLDINFGFEKGINLFNSLNLEVLHEYITKQVNSFFNILRLDIRTKSFTLKEIPIKNAIEVSKNSSSPFIK